MGTIQIDGSTPKLTIGNATAEDALILFDGNAQDFHIGLDDSSEDLVIGVGSALGTTTALAIDENAGSTFSGTVTVGVDDTGKDVKFFGATASRYWLWDESADGVVQRGTLTVGVDDTGHDVKLFGATAGSYWLWDESADGVVQVGTLTVGVDDAGHDVKLFGNAAGAYMEWDASADELRLMGASADATTSTGKLLLATSLTNINANDVLGKIDFQAPHEAGGTDAITVAASIRAIAQSTFSASSNATDLVFYTGHSEAAAEKVRITSQNEIGIAGANYGTDGQVLTSGGAGAAVAWEDAGGVSTLGGLTDVTMDATNFTDGLLIQTNSDGSAPGTGTLSSANDNIGIGKNVFAALTSGDNNVVIGNGAGAANTTGNTNTFIGTGAGTANTTGTHLTVLGMNAYDQADTETYNTAIGVDSMGGAVAGSEGNTCVGFQTGFALTSGGNLTAMGHLCGDTVTTGSDNSLYGYSAGTAITTGYSTTCMGKGAGQSVTDGHSIVCIGMQADVSGGSNYHNIVIGHNFVGASNDFSFGKASNVVTNDFDADADWSRSSDERIKRNIEDSTLGLEFIKDLRPVKFQWKPSPEVPEELTTEYNVENQKNLDIIMHGFIAQEVKEAIDKHGDTTFGGWHLDKIDGVTQRTKKNMFIMPLVKAVQELSAQVTTLQNEIKTLKGD